MYYFLAEGPDIRISGTTNDSGNTATAFKMHEAVVRIQVWKHDEEPVENWVRVFGRRWEKVT